MEDEEDVEGDEDEELEVVPPACPVPAWSLEMAGRRRSAHITQVRQGRHEALPTVAPAPVSPTGPP